MAKQRSKQAVPEVAAAAVPVTAAERPVRSDYFTWKPGDLVLVSTPVLTPEERLQAILAELPEESRAKVEAILARERGVGG